LCLLNVGEAYPDCGVVDADPERYWLAGGGQNYHVNGVGLQTKSWADLAEFVRLATETYHPNWKLVLNSPTDASMSPICYKLYIDGKIWPFPGGYQQECGSYFYPSQSIFSINACPRNYTFNTRDGKCYPNLPDMKICPDAKKEPSQPDYCGVGNPINPGIGSKYEVENDFGGNSTFALEFKRYYSRSSDGRTLWSRLGSSWSHNYNRFISISTSFGNPTSSVTVNRADGKKYQYFLTNGNYLAASPDVTNKVSATSNGWQYYDDVNKNIEEYDNEGKLLKIISNEGRVQTFTYTDSTESKYPVNAPDCKISLPVGSFNSTGAISCVTDDFGRQIRFAYDTAERIKFIVDPAGGVFTYQYTNAGNLSVVTYPDNTQRQYLYNELGYTGGANLADALTGLIDENGNRFATYTYDTTGKAISTEHAGGAERVSLTYNADGSTTVTDALNTARTYNFQTILGVVKSAGQSQPGGSGCGASASALSYDANGNVASRTDFNGNRTHYTYDLTRNLETSRTEGLTATGATTPATRTITTVWHPTFRLPVQITNANQQTTYTYNPQGDITQKTIKDTAANTTRSWNTAYTYATVPGVLLQKVEDGPRTDVSDLTTYDYYPADAACAGGHLGCRGQLKQITDALGHITHLTRYSAHGQLEELTDPNGLVTIMTYDVRQRLTSLDTGGEITTYTYDPAGQVTRVTRPDGAYLAYTYDAAHRLIKTQDNLGNTLTYTLDAMGNRIKEDVLDPGGQLARTQSRIYDALSRIQNLILPQ